MSKVALITGVTGQDGSYLAELLLEKGYECMASNAAVRCLTPIVSIICIRIRMRLSGALLSQPFSENYAL
ncbi:GDP-mannose 4,6-dehydratase [Thiorhodovibrio winogradskyi]|uniref:GDP-mannose 4,6-dehydratase n=1 Tax=Thiorhodovibrio winogradskyi TaxID=77007 RepID=A0ABZ0S4U8_9GAMM